jgi:hypothetical protein
MTADVKNKDRGCKHDHHNANQDRDGIALAGLLHAHGAEAG